MQNVRPCYCNPRGENAIKIIVNGDDLGMSSSINEEIIGLLSEKRITSITVIANAPEVEEAIRHLPKRSDYSVGVHLNLTEFYPLTKWSETGLLAAILDDKGCFAGEEVFRATELTAPLRDAIFRELCLQVEKIKSMGVNVSHFDSHNHIHTIPWFFPVLKRLQRYFNVRKVRIARNIYAPGLLPSRIVQVKKYLWNSALRSYYHTKTTSGFGALAALYKVAMSKKISHGSVEVMVHPGHPGYQDETWLLRSEWQRDIPFDIELISFHDL